MVGQYTHGRMKKEPFLGAVKADLKDAKALFTFSFWVKTAELGFLGGRLPHAVPL